MLMRRKSYLKISSVEQHELSSAEAYKLKHNCHLITKGLGLQIVNEIVILQFLKGDFTDFHIFVQNKSVNLRNYKGKKQNSYLLIVRI